MGRVGALAVSLGIGAAVITGPGVAFAGTGTTGSGTAASNGDSGAASAPSVGSRPASRGAAKDRNARQPIGQNGNPASPKKVSAELTAPPVAADTATRSAGDSGGTVRSKKRRPPTLSAGRAGVGAVLRSAVVDGGQKTAQADSATMSTPLPAGVNTVPAEVPTPLINTVVRLSLPVRISQQEAPATVLTALAAAAPPLNSQTADIPATPLQATTFAGLLELARRELEYAFFNATPQMHYIQSANTVTDDGDTVGHLDATDADGDALTYKVTRAPKDGSVTVAADGTFTYTPSAALKAAGGTDTFTITVSDTPGNPPHLHGLNTLVGADFGSTDTAHITVIVPPAGTTEVSPLATADQLAAEQLATRIVNSPIVKFAKFILKVAWTITAYIAYGKVGGPDKENLAQLDEAIDEYALQAAFELQLLNPNSPTVIQQVMPGHDWFGESFGGARILFDNPDTIYRMIPVNTASSYVITGQFTGPVPADTTFSVLTGLTGKTTSVITGDQLVVDADGRFTITVDSRATDPNNPNHLQLTSGATLIAARNTLADWNTEVPMTLSVQRISGPPNSLASQLGLFDIPVLGPLLTGNPLLLKLVSAVPALPTVPLWLRQVETALVMALGLIMEPQYIGVSTGSIGNLKAPNTFSNPVHNAAFLATQVQSAGYFQLADDQALVITIDMGNAAYFNVPVTNDWTITDNYWDQQTSLNSFQATPDTPGGKIYTIVVSPTDPGVANWVSTGGLNQGTISIRFQGLDLTSSQMPTVSATVVQVADVLPDGTEPITAAQRAAQIALRQSGYNRRYTPYLQA
ncbi:MAG TPA: Ig-like domain-containing protein [Mycobacterium sp.]|nr:Ig-like domain-containing protein [Mycobacterium sp.]